MAEAAAHRAPHGIHYWQGADAGMAHLSLKVAPESLHEHQPLLTTDGDLVLVADARVDNRHDLIQMLSGKGFLCDSEPADADLILAAYRCWDLEAPAHIIGDFAFAIWDARQRHLFAARDPMGMRALYYRSEPRRLLFATEVTQILAAPNVPVRLFEPAVYAHLAANFDRQDWTFYEGVEQLKPGHALLACGDQQRTWRYWDIDFERRIRYRDEREYAEHLLALLQEAVRCRTRSLNPAGILLSGGLDSGSIASTFGWMQKRGLLDYNAPLHTYSWAFTELAECDERHISDIVVRHYNLPATYIPAESEYPLKGYPEQGPDRDEPFDGPFRPLIEAALSRAQRHDVRTLLIGGRGDLAMGSRIFDYLGLLVHGHWHTLINDLRAQSHSTGRPMRAVVKMYLWATAQSALWPTGQAEWLRQVLRRALKRPRPQLSFPDWIQPSFAKQIRLDSMRPAPSATQPPRDPARRERYDAIFSAVNMRSAVWADRMAARYRMTIADPWSDRRIASFSMAVPQRLLNRPGDEKRLVRQAMSGVMPEAARQAATKIVPLPLYEKALKELARDQVLALLHNPKVAARGYISEQMLNEYYQSYCAGTASSPHFWYTLTLEAWLREHL